LNSQSVDAILALDQGTSSSRAMLFDRQGRVLAQAQQEISCSFPQPGWVEQDAEQVWWSVLAVCREVMHQAKQLQVRVCAMAITNQRETSVLWHRDSHSVVAPAIVWQDRRTQERCQQLREQGFESLLQQKTGLCADPYFSASKLQWLLDQYPAVRQNPSAYAFGTIDSFLLWRLSNGTTHATDTTNASRTALFNIDSLQWDDQLLALFDVPRDLLPAVRPSAGVFGYCDVSWFGEALPILAMAGDQQAAALGQGCIGEGGLKSTYGTGCFALLNTGNKRLTSNHQLLTTIAYTVQGQTHYALEGSIFVAGAAVKWLRDQLGVNRHASETEVLAASIPDNRGVYLVPAFTGLGAPYWRADVTASWTGLTLATGRAELARAVLEAVAYQTYDLLMAMQADGAVLQRLQVDGGMVNNSWFCQFLADLLQLPVMRPLQTETTAFGVALLAGIELGWYQGLADLPTLVQAESWFKPADTSRREQNIAGWQAAVARVLAED